MFYPDFSTFQNGDFRARSSYQWQGQAIAAHGICGMQLIVPAFDICFWNITSHNKMIQIYTATGF